MSAASKYNDSMPVQLIEMASQGKFMVQIASIWGVSKRTLEMWALDDSPHPEFAAAYPIARTCCEAYWADVGQKGAKGLLKGFQHGPWSKIMGTVFKDDWSEATTQKIELNNNIKNMTTDEIDDTIKALLASRAMQKIPSQGGAPAEVA